MFLHPRSVVHSPLQSFFGLTLEEGGSGPKPYGMRPAHLFVGRDVGKLFGPQVAVKEVSSHLHLCAEDPLPW